MKCGPIRRRELDAKSDAEKLDTITPFMRLWLRVQLTVLSFQRDLLCIVLKPVQIGVDK